MSIALLSLFALPQQPKGAATPPRLVVLISVDQLVPEQLQRLEPYLTGGLGRFLREGTVFWRATVDYACTETGPGHATIATGRFPRSTCIVHCSACPWCSAPICRRCRRRCLTSPRRREAVADVFGIAGTR